METQHDEDFQARCTQQPIAALHIPFPMCSGHKSTISQDSFVKLYKLYVTLFIHFFLFNVHYIMLSRLS